MKYFLFITVALMSSFKPINGNLNQKYFILPYQGTNLYDSMDSSANVIAFIPYNEEVSVIKQTTMVYQEGIFSSQWLKVKYKNVYGFCPLLHLYKNKLPDSINLKKITLENFLIIVAKNKFSYKRTNEEYHSADSFFIQGIKLSDCYSLMKLYLKKDLPFPKELNRQKFSFPDGTVECTYSIDYKYNSVTNLKLNWIFDGGNTNIKWVQFKNGVGTKIDYFPD